MAKQKSGLGRGLNALFDEAASYQQKEQVSSYQKQPSEEQENPQKTKDEPQDVKAVQDAEKEAQQQPARKDQVASVKQPEENKKEFQEPKERTTQEIEDIYFSEEALEKAKVVEREARPRPSVKNTKAVRSTGSSSTNSKNTNDIKVKKSQDEIEKALPEVSDKDKQSVSSNDKKPNPQTNQPKAQPQREEDGSLGEIAIDKIVPNADQPRTNFKPEELEELANSIKREGLLQPILVRKKGEQYEIIAGERRWQACKQVGMKKIPVRFWKADNDKAIELALVENIQRSDLNPIEEAYGYKRLMERKGMTQSEVAQTVSKGRSTIANALRLLELPEEAQQLLFEDKITAGHARAILSIPSAEGRQSLTNKLVSEKLSVREAESIARLLAGRDNRSASNSKRPALPASYKSAARSLSKVLSVPVRVKTVQGKNKIEIQFKDEEELERLLDQIIPD